MPNLLASIGRSGAVGDFVKEARLIRQQNIEQEISNKKLGMEKEDRKSVV